MFPSTTVGRQFGPYLILDVLGRGASATVYLGERSDGARVAVKVLSALAMGNADFRRAVGREYNALVQLEHRGVIRANRTGTIADVLFIELEHVPGPTLAEVVEPGKSLPLARVVQLGIAVAEALQHCHDRGIVHRDVKPSNLLLRTEDDPVLFDFGLAQDAADPDAEPGRIYATPMTASPEQIRAEGAVDGRADVYALGVTLFRLATGRLPFVGERMELLRMHVEEEAPRATSIDKRIPGDLDELLAVALQKRVDDRFASARDMGRALRSLDPDGLEIRRVWRRR